MLSADIWKLVFFAEKLGGDLGAVDIMEWTMIVHFS